MSVSGHSGVALPVGIPEDGAAGTVLKKVSGQDYDVDWLPDNDTGGGGGVTESQLSAAMGVALALADDRADGEMPPVIPGERGADGATGATGSPGASLPVVLQPEDAEEAPVIPGERGAAGAAGVDGVSPAPIVIYPDDPDDVWPIPGERGATGANGADGSSAAGAPIVIYPEDIDYEMPEPRRDGVALLDAEFQRFNGPQIIKADVVSGVASYEQLMLTNYDDVTLGLSFYDLRSNVDNARSAIIQSFGVCGLVTFSDDKTIQRNAVLVDRLPSTGPAIQRQRYGNSTDHPVHDFFGGIQQSILYGTSEPLITIATETTLHYIRRMQIQGTRRLTLVGTARLRVTN